MDFEWWFLLFSFFFRKKKIEMNALKQQLGQYENQRRVCTYLISLSPPFFNCVY